MRTYRSITLRSGGLRPAVLTGLVTAPMLLTVLLTGCSGSTAAAPASSPTVVSTPTTVVTSTSEAVVTTTDVVTDTAEITELTGVTRNGGGDDHSGSTPNPCPDTATLSTVTPNYDPQYPINAINCGGEWAVGTYEADGKNQTTGIWRNTGGSWAYQDRAAICATADNLPDELYAQACEGN